MRRRQAEANTRADEWGGGISDDNNRDLAFKHLSGESWHLGGIVKHEGDDRGIIMTEDDEAKTFETETEVTRVEGKTLKTFFTFAGIKFSGDHFQGRGDLGDDAGGGGFRHEDAGVDGTEFIDDVLFGGDVAAVGTEGFGKSAHEDIDVAGINTEEIADTAATGAQSTDGVSFVNEEVESVLLSKSDQGGEIAHGTFHGVETFDNDKNLLPRPVSTRLTLRDILAKLVFQVAHVVVLEHINHGTGATSTGTDGSMVELVRDDETALANQG